MSRVVIFGGTTEGRLLAEYCVQYHIDALISVTSDYGADLLPVASTLRIQNESLEEEQIQKLLRNEKPELLLDATHPYAKVVTGYLECAAREYQIPYLRVLREAMIRKSEKGIIWVDSVPAAVAYLAKQKGSVLLTTGSKDLSLFQALPDFVQRVYARVLPSQEAIGHCRNLGMKGDHVIGMQGPFSTELNAAMIRQLKIQYLVTKEAGDRGGYQEKLAAADLCGIEAVIIGRPTQEDGISVEEACETLADFGQPDLKRCAVIGFGMGDCRHLSLAAVEALKESQVIFGSKRLLEQIGALTVSIPKLAVYQAAEIVAWLECHSQVTKVAVLYSGDIGFYSGAQALLWQLQTEPWQSTFEVNTYPGISSITYFCAKLNLSWERFHCASFHGREGDICGLVKTFGDVFVLLDGNHRAEQVCQALTDGGYGEAVVAIGENLSYPEERIQRGQADCFCQSTFAALTVMVILTDDKLLLPASFGVTILPQ